MNNILLDPLPTEYNGYKINTSFRIGIQLCLLQDEEDLSNTERYQIIKELLFGNEDGSVRPTPADFGECYTWFINGWNHDRHITDTENKNKRIMDFDIDQFRIYADFLNIYGIDLNTVEMHWWAFQGLLWNMPHKLSSFLQCLEIRTKKPHKKASAEERKAIENAHKRFDLPSKKAEKEYTSVEIAQIDAFDEMMAQRKAKKSAKDEIIKEFTGG